MPMLVIFDLDQTLIDSQHIEHLRKSRNWSAIYKKIPTITAYNRIDDVLSIVESKGIKLGLVTSSPSSYAQRVVRHFGWSFDVMVCYHDTSQHKPHPEPFLEAANRLKIPAQNCWAIGDNPNDIIGARRAGMYAVAALWGSCDKESLKDTKPDIQFETVSSLYDEVYENFSSTK